MKKIHFMIVLFTSSALFMLLSCQSPITLTSWKNPQSQSKVSKVVVMPLFEKLEYMKPFEQSIVGYFNSKGLKSLGSLDFLNPTIKYPINDIKQKCDSMGADAIVIFIYQGTDKSESYIPPTTYYTGGYGGFGGYWGGGYWGAGYYGAVQTTGGYWTQTSIIHLTSKLYVKGSKDALWTGEISIEDPQYVDKAAYGVAEELYADWKKNQLIKVTNQ